MQNTFSNFTVTQSFVKIGCCSSTGDLVFLPESSNNFSEESFDKFIDNLPYEYLHFDPFLIFNDLLAEREVRDMLLKIPECYGFFPKKQFPDMSFPAKLIFTEFHDKKAHYEDSVRGLILSLLSMITRNITKDSKVGKADSMIQSALLFIHNNYAGKLSVNDVARHCNISESHFRRRFHEIMLTSPLDYINSLRIHKASQLIYHSDMHINEIAQAVGFTTLSSFNRQFQAFFCTSPTKWRQNNDGPMSQIRYTVTTGHDYLY